jgi:glycine dehydrogenase subunit 2
MCWLPESAHGTNPASTTMAGLNALEIPSNDRGNIDLMHYNLHKRARCDRMNI